jgi:hypothetical protein
MITKSLYIIQALLAVTEVVQQLNEKNPSFIHVNENEPTKFVLLSLGTGGPAATLKFGALYGGTLSANQWIQIIAGGLAVSAGDINEYHLKTVFPGPPFSDNYYLRIDVTSSTFFKLFAFLCFLVFIYLSFKKKNKANNIDWPNFSFY